MSSIDRSNRLAIDAALRGAELRKSLLNSFGTYNISEITQIGETARFIKALPRFKAIDSVGLQANSPIYAALKSMSHHL